MRFPFAVSFSLAGAFLLSACPDTPATDVDAGMMPAPDAGPNFGDVIAGLEFFADNGCASCHCNSGQGGCNVEAPNIQSSSLNSLRANLVYASTAEENPELADPFDPHPLKLPRTTDVELAQLTAFLATLTAGATVHDDSLVARGYELYVGGTCIACHLVSAQGTAQGGIGQAIAGSNPDIIYGALSGLVPCHPMQKSQPPPEVDCSILGHYIVDNPVVTRLTDVAPPNTDEERYLLAHFLAFIAPPPTGGMVEPCNKVSGEICTIVGNGIGGYNKDGITATESLLYFPQDMTLFDRDGDGVLELVIADWNNHRVRQVFIDTEKDGVKDRIETIAGNSKVTGADTLNHPTDVTFGPDGELYIAGWHNQNVYKYPKGLVDGGDRDVLVGRCLNSCTDDTNPTDSTTTFLGGPVSVARHPDGRIFVSESSCVRVRELNVQTASISREKPAACPTPAMMNNGTIITTLAGKGAGYEGDEGPARVAKFNANRGTSFPNFRIALEPGPDPERIYVADTGNNMIRYINIKDTPPTVHFLAGKTGPEGVGYKDGVGAEARFNFPTNVFVDTRGLVYVADSRNHAIRLITREGRVTTIAGNGRAGFNGDNIPATMAQLSNPNGVLVHPDGRIFISDTNNSRIRVITP